MKKWTALLLAAILCTAHMTGCMAEEEKPDGLVSGYYQERYLELPEEAYTDYTVSVLSLDEEGNLYLSQEKKDGTQRWRQNAAGGWEAAPVGAGETAWRKKLEGVAAPDGTPLVTESFMLQQTADGWCGLLAEPAEDGEGFLNDRRWYFETSGENITVREFPEATGIENLGANMLYLLGERFLLIGGNSQLIVVDRETLEITQTLPQPINCRTVTYENDLYFVYGGIIQRFHCDGRGRLSKEKEIVYTEDDTVFPFVKLGFNDPDDLVIADAKGVHVWRKDSEWVETVLDGGQCSFGAGLLDVCDIVKAGGDKIYILSKERQLGGKCYLFEYEWKEGLPPPTQSLTIEGLWDDAYIQELIFAFKLRHPNTAVSYTPLTEYPYYNFANSGDVKLSQEEKHDLLQVLNTRILAGTGPDILLLDGLPASEYAAEGALEDMSGWLEPMTRETGGIDRAFYENALAEDGGLYEMPMRIAPFYTMGPEEAMKAAERLDTLAAYQQSSGKPLFQQKFYTAEKMAAILARVYQYELWKDGELSEEDLQAFLDDLVLILQNAVLQTIPNANVASYNHALKCAITDYFEGSSLMVYCLYDGVNPYGGYGDNDMTPFSGLAYFMHHDEDSAFYPVKGRYAPLANIGVSSTNGNPELAREFIEFAFSEEGQQLLFNDMLPVRQKVRRENYQRQWEDGRGVYEEVLAGAEEGDILDDFTQQDVERLVEYHDSYTTAVKEDPELTDALAEAAVACYNDEKTTRQAAKELYQIFRMKEWEQAF